MANEVISQICLDGIVYNIKDNSVPNQINVAVNDITKSIPDSLSDLSSDSTHRTVTDAEKTTWNAKSNFSGNYNDLINKPTIPSISGLATESYADSAATTAANKVKDDLLNGAGEAYDTLKELGELIDDNQDAIDALEIVAAEKADKTHSHVISDISGLQSALDGKASSSHGTHVSFDSTNTPKMDGTAAFGTSSNVARADHVHPSDTSRASKTEFDTHTANTTAHITSTERTNWNAAKTHADSAHAPSNAEKNQNAFSNIKVGTTTIAADTTTDTFTLVAGNNVTITPDATNDKVTIAATDTVYTHPNSGVTAGTYKSVTINAQGHVTGGSNPTTLSGYGITDAVTKAQIADVVYSDDSDEYTATVPLNADTLGGHPASDFFTNGKLGNLTYTDVDAAPANLAKYTSYGAKNNYCTNLLDIRIDDINAVQNQMSVVATEDATTLVNSPVGSGAFYAHREVQLIDSPYGRGSKAIVKLTEMYPQAGRIWINAYNPDTSSWSGWKLHELTDYVYNFALNNNDPIKNNYITDVLSVDLYNPNSTSNRSGYFDSSANACPPNVAFGVREVYFVNPGFVIVEARCFMTDSSTKIFRRTYNQNAGGWLGWNEVYDSGHKPTATDVGAVPSTGGTVSGTLEVNNGTSAGYVSLSEDGEGGTIRIGSKNGTYVYEVDAAGDNHIRMHTAEKRPSDVPFHVLQWWADTGTLETDYVAPWNPIDVAHGGTGATDAATARANLGAAPSGYGWGETDVWPYAPYGDPDYVDKSCNFVVSQGNIPAAGIWFGQYIAAGSNGDMTVRAITGQVGCICKRYKLNGVWQPWEWVNPPMGIGVEYRTVERYKGKPVYVKAVELNLAGAGYKSVAVAGDMTEVVSFEGYVLESGLYSFSVESINEITREFIDGGAYKISSSDLPNHTAKAIVKYVK